MKHDTKHIVVMMVVYGGLGTNMYDNQDKYLKYLLWFALAYFGGHVLYYIGLELSCYIYGILQ
jgi:hypothetical protein